VANADILALAGQPRTIVSLVAADGSATTRQFDHLADNFAPLRDLADAIHALCVVHGAFPGVVDHVRGVVTDGAVIAWLDRAADAMAIERALLARLTAAVGPLPSTPGQAASEAAVLAQRHALQMLARSDRNGCAIGAAIAFVLDWEAVRRVLDTAAERLSIAVDGEIADLVGETRRMMAAMATTPAIDRAMIFGAQQLLAQHRGLWDLLEARASAREAA
jgi:hypothetical protein